MANAERRTATHRRLVLAKALYLHGRERSYAPGPLDKMIAVHSLHNAIEVTLRTIVRHHEIRPETRRDLGFDQMLDVIDKFAPFKDKDLRLPNKSDIRNLNKKRNLVQHDAYAPETEAMEELRVHTRDFLANVFQDYFDLPFDRVSQVTLVADERLRRILELSAQALDGSDWSEAARLAKIAFAYAKPSASSVLSSPTRVEMWEAASLDPLSSIPQIINRHAEYLAAIGSGVSLIDYRRFEEIPIEASLSSAGRPASMMRAGEIAKDDARWGHEFVIDTIIKWQLAGLNPTVSDRLAVGCNGFIHEQIEATGEEENAPA